MDPRKMSDRDIERRIAEILISELKLENVTAEGFDPRLDLVDELGIDSMDLTTVALVLQDEFKMTIDEDDYPNLKSVGAIRDYIRSKFAEA
jgi:acyl carrier protein